MIVVSTVLRAIRPALAGATVNGRWTPGIGDPTILGWVTVFGYALAVVLCVRAMLKAKRASTDASAFRVVLFWGILAGITLLPLHQQTTRLAVLVHSRWKGACQEKWLVRRAARHPILVHLGCIGWGCWSDGLFRLADTRAFPAARACPSRHGLLGMFLSTRLFHALRRHHAFSMEERARDIDKQRHGTRRHRLCNRLRRAKQRRGIDNCASEEY